MSHWVGGIHAVQALLEHQPDAVSEVVIQAGRKDRRLQPIIDRARNRSINSRELTRRDMDALEPGLRHQGVMARVEGQEQVTEADLERVVAASDRPLVLVLDGVTDPHNLGACLRTADAVGVDLVIAPRDRAVGLTPVVRKVACGAAETVPFVAVTNLARTLDRLREMGLWVVGAAGETDADIYQAGMDRPLVLVMGAEGAGLRRLTRERCDELVRIPMAGTVESLNVSVATGVCLYEAVRQRGAGRS
ncbi:MAG: 23S rRNA (guanosine(2251)-2'-O)-methyltransferase RlmB [Gammaproteobacteria bacterium]